MKLNTRCQTLLAYHILYRQQAHTRQQLAFQFWPDSSESQARTNLRKAIHHLRQTLPQADQFVRINRQTMQWQPDAPFSLDVEAFETAVTQAQQSNEPTCQRTNLQQAITLYHGDLLPGHYDDWILAARERLRQQYLTGLEQLVQLLEAERQYQPAIGYAHRLLREDPLHEAAYRRLMRLQALDGNVAGALRVYHTCVTTLQQELGVPPGPATQETYEQLLNMEAHRLPDMPGRIPLVARQKAWATLRTAWRQASDGLPGTVLLSGEAGIGKTRLAEELLDWTGRQGITVVAAACYAAEGRLPYAPIADWLRSDELQHMWPRLADRWLVECARLRPNLLAQRPHLASPGPLTEDWQRQHFFTALAQAVLAARQPPATRLPPKVQAVIETRLSQLSPTARALTNLAAAIGRSFTFDLLALASRVDEEVAVRGLDELWQRRIVREQGANAYDFTHDKLRQVTYDGLSTARRRLLHGRIVTALETLHAHNLDAVSGQLAAHYEAARQFATAVDHYQRAAAVAQTIFAHQETAVYLRRAINLLPNLPAKDGLTSQLHEQLGDSLALMKRYDEAEAVYDTAVTHATSPIQQARLYGKIGHACNSHQQYEPAYQAFDKSLHLLDTVPQDTEWQETWLDIQLNRADMFYFQAKLEELAELIAVMKAPIDQFGTVGQKVTYLRTDNMLQYRRKRFALDESNVTTTRTILDLAKQLNDTQAEANERFGLGFALVFSGQIAAGIETLALTLHQSEQNGNIFLQDQCVAYLGIAYRFQGDEAQVRNLAERGLALSEKVPNLFYKGVAQANLAWIAYRNGRYTEAAALGDAVMARWQGVPYPLYWVALWPVLGTAVTQDNLEKAVNQAEAMLHPIQQKLPERITAVLQQAITAWETNQPQSAQTHLRQAIQLAQETGHL